MANSLSPDKQAVQKFFTEDVEHYAQLFHSKRTGNNFTFRRRLELALELSSGLSGNFLDCACGTGEITAALLGTGRFQHATLLDLSPRMIEAAQDRVRQEQRAPAPERIRFATSDVFAFLASEPPGRYDLIACLGLIAHTGRLAELLNGLRRMLLPGGGILLQSTVLDHWGTKVTRALTAERYFRRHGYRIAYYELKDLEQAIRGAGLTAKISRRFGVGLPLADRCWSWGNFQVECRGQRWAERHGSEIIYLLTQP